MRILLTSFILFCCYQSVAQSDGRITTLDFVQVKNNNFAEARYYYQQNWEQLRIKALERDYIHSYELMETSSDSLAPFHLILQTTYKDSAQYLQREENFGELIKEMGGLKLLNEKPSKEFREIIYGKEPVYHLNQKTRTH